MKKTKLIIPALGMLLLSTAASVTGTVAWFSMNNSVTATGMTLQIKAEDGILISNAAKTTWSDSSTAIVGSAVLVPTSAAAVASPAFVSASSTNSAEAQAQQAVANYTDLTLAWNTTTNSVSEGKGYVDADSDNTLDTDEKCYVLLNNFYIKSSGNAITQKASETLLYINDVTASLGENATYNKIDNALRVLVVVNTNAFIYAPVIDQASGTTTVSYKWKNTTSVSALAPTTYDQACASVTSISNQDANATNIKIYCYFEGEDENCTSDNMQGITVNDISVVVNFGTIVKHPAQQQQNP